MMLETKSGSWDTTTLRPPRIARPPRRGGRWDSAQTAARSLIPATVDLLSECPVGAANRAQPEPPAGGRRVVGGVWPWSLLLALMPLCLTAPEAVAQFELEAVVLSETGTNSEAGGTTLETSGGQGIIGVASAQDSDLGLGYIYASGDRQSPVTTLRVNDSAASATNLVLVSTDSLGFAATDSESGVLETRYSLDGSTIPVVFVSNFNLTLGSHTLSFHSVDRAGNLEVEKAVSLTIFIYDVIAPTLELAPPDASTVTSATPLLAANYSDAGRGVDPTTFRLSLDGVDITTQAVVGVSSAIVTLYSPINQGFHTLTAQVSDFTGNSTAATSSFRIDSLPPVTSCLIDGLPSFATNLVLISTDSLGFSATDSGVGSLETRYALDGSTTEVVFVSTFSLAAGAHTLTFRSVDHAGNVELAKTVTLSVLLFDAAPPTLILFPVSGSTFTTTTPALAASYSDLGRGVDPASVRLKLDGLDQTSSAVVTVSSASFTPSAALSQGTHTLTVFVSDLSENSASASSDFFIDSLPPLTTLLVNGLPVGGASLVLASTDAVSFASGDSGVGVLETRYSVDSAAEAVFAVAFFLSPGNHALSFRSSDRAGNLEVARTATISVASASSDTTPPLVRLDFPGAAGLGVEQAVGGVLNVRGAVSDVSALSWRLEVAPGAATASGFATIADGAGNLSGLITAWNTRTLSGYQTLRLRATDAFGNVASATATVFIGNPVFTFAIGRKDSNVIVNKIKNPTGIAIRSDGLIWVVNSEENELILLTPSGSVVTEVDGEDGHGHSHGHGHGHRDDDGGGDGASFKHPQGLALDAASSLYVADKGNDRVVKLSADGSQVLLQLAKLDNHGRPKPGSGAGELRQPHDVVVDSNGDIYVADSGNDRIQVFNSSGVFLRQFGQNVFPRKTDIRGVTLTEGGLWVSDKESERIYLFTRAGALVKSIGDADSIVGEISRTRGLASDRFGALYVAEPNRDRTQKFDPQGKGLLSFGSRAGLSQADKQAKRYLTEPIDAAVAPDGSIWITDTGRSRIVRYSLPTTGGYVVAAMPAVSEAAAPSSERAEPARRIVDHRDGARVERDDDAGVFVPAGALAADLEITVDQGDENQDKEQKSAKRSEKNIAAVSGEVQYGPEGTVFNTPVTLTVPYDAGLLASQGVKESELKLYYWNPALQDWQAMASTVDKQNKTVSAQTAHFSLYQVQGLGGGIRVAAAIEDFGLRAVYAFPNPIRGGATATFRIQPGRADSVEVRVYDVSGRKVYSSSDFRFSVLDDGNGKGVQNTYDHIWDVSGVGSGVYTFVITARKAGQADIRKTGKVGVIK